jgi:hypothetical protein
MTVCIFPAGTLSYPNGGGYLWIYLNWALGLRELGCRVIWLEEINTETPLPKAGRMVVALKGRLERYGLAESLALCSRDGKPLPEGMGIGCLSIDDAAEADLLLNQRYGASSEIIRRFRRTALLDIDPGLLQIWMSKGWLRVAPHDMYFTIGEGVAHKNPNIPDLGLQWRHTPPCVSMEWWPVRKLTGEDSAFTTLTHWYAGGGAADSSEAYEDDKRSGFLPYLDLPRRTTQPLELALDVASDRNERTALCERGWRVQDSYSVASTPWEYQVYVQDSRGEFSCAKPSYVRLETGWVSDRTVCYLASGKPAVVQYTGPSRLLPDSEGLFRFRNVEEAALYLEKVSADYEHQCHLARTLAEEHFDARKVLNGVLEHSLT